MWKYPTLKGRQRKLCKDKAVLPENRVLMTLDTLVSYGFIT